MNCYFCNTLLKEVFKSDYACLNPECMCGLDPKYSRLILAYDELKNVESCWMIIIKHNKMFYFDARKKQGLTYVGSIDKYNKLHSLIKLQGEFVDSPTHRYIKVIDMKTFL